MRAGTAVLALALATSGCATMYEGTTQPIPITSSPEGAAILVNGVPQWTTPHVMAVPKKNPPPIMVRLDGYQPVTVQLERAGIEPWFWGNVFTYGLGALVDWQTGAMWKLPDRVVVELVRDTVQ